MGDVAMTVPVLRAFTAQHPEVKVTVVSRPFFKPLFDTLPVSFFAFDEKGRHKGIAGLIQLFRDLKARDIDGFADLHNVLRSKVVRKLFAFSGTRTAAVDKGRADKKALTRAENKVFKPLTSMFQRHAHVLEQLGFPIDLSHPEFPQPALLDAKIREISGNKDGRWIGVAPFAQYEGKVYPQDLMQRVIDLLSRQSPNKIFLFGGKSDKTQLEALAIGKNNVIVLAGALTFDQELQLISNLDVMLSMDSGNAHLAAMLGVKTVTLWGATHPYAGFAPFGQPLENALTANRETYPLLPTSVYGNKKVAGYQDAMRTIDPQHVAQIIETILSNP